MKQIKVLSFIAIYMTMFVACQNEAFISEQDVKQNTDSWKRNVAEAISIAQKASTMGMHITRAGNHQRTVNQNKVYAIKTEKTRSFNSSVLDTLLYVINYEDNRGYAIVSASKFTEEIIAVIDTGRYDGSFVGSPAFQQYMEQARNYVASKSLERIQDSTYIRGPKPFSFFDTVLEEHIVTPKVQVRWGQTGAEGSFCSNGVSGCCNTAVAQIMTYFKYPSSIQLTYPNSNNEIVSLNWNNICQHKTSNSDNCSEVTHNMIGKLVRQIGELSNSTYYPVSGSEPAYTSTYLIDSKNGISSLGYSVSNIIGYNTGIYDNILIGGGLIVMGGEDSNEEGHAWIIDGCNYQTIRHVEFAGFEVIYDVTTSYNYNHINWGWDGFGNGYFTDGVFNATSPHTLDGYPLITSDDYNFISNLRYFSVFHN